jgi:hypothetical protein
MLMGTVLLYIKCQVGYCNECVKFEFDDMALHKTNDS